MSNYTRFFNKKLIFFTLFCGIVSPIAAHIHRIEHWSNGDQSLYLVHDYHVSSNPQNKICDQQQLELLEAAKQHNAFVITEDMSVYNNKAFFTDTYNYDPNVPAVHKHRKKHPSTRPPIVGLTVHCQDQKIPVCNIEFRQASVASRNGEKRIPARLTLAISNKIRDEIKNYNDGPVLNKYYQDEVTLYDKNISNAQPIFTPINNSDEPLQQVIPRLEWCRGADDIIKAGTHFDDYGVTMWSKDSRLGLATDLYDMRLVNARALHIAHQNKNKPCIFICLGSEHIRQMKPAFSLTDYKCTGVVGESYITKHGTSTEPDAIDIKHAFDTLPKPKVQPKAAEQANSNTILMVLIALVILILLMLFNKKKPIKNIKTTAGILLFIASMLTQSSLHGYIYCVDVLESPKYKTKIVLLSDVHIEGQDSVKQKNDIVSWVKQAKIQTATEDNCVHLSEKGGIDFINCEYKEDICLGLDKKIGSHLVSCVDKRLPIQLLLTSNPSFGSIVTSNYEKTISILRNENYNSPLNQYKNKILLEFKDNILPKCETLFKAIEEKNGSFSDRIKKIQYNNSWNYIIRSAISHRYNTRIDVIQNLNMSSIKKIERIIRMYDSSLLDAAACNFINKSVQNNAPIICLILGGAHIETIVHPLTDKKMGFTRTTIAGKTFEQAEATTFEPVQNLYCTLTEIYYPSFFERHESSLTLAGSALLSLCIGNTYGSNQSILTQVGLTLSTFFGSIAGYNLIKSGLHCLTRRHNHQNYQYHNEIKLS